MPASIVTVGPTPHVAEINAKLVTAVQKDREWFATLILNTLLGEALPCSPRFGITSTEYAHLLHAPVVLDKAGSTTLKVTTSGQSITFGRTAGAALLGGVTVDLARNVVRTPLGTTAEGKPVDVQDENLGPRSGVQWATPVGSDQGRTATSIRLTVTHLQRTDDVMLDDEVRVVKGGQQVRNDEVMLACLAVR
ncbi:hypothetical protein [Deinococcus sonorensis]|uniref:Uncharacterized protein n=2 Tax=Deinococcus sonorensis TaxID=309891 RepID=A0AAU7U4V1_9DEIO